MRSSDKKTSSVQCSTSDIFWKIGGLQFSTSAIFMWRHVLTANNWKIECNWVQKIWSKLVWTVNFIPRGERVRHNHDDKKFSEEAKIPPAKVSLLLQSVARLTMVEEGKDTVLDVFRLLAHSLLSTSPSSKDSRLQQWTPIQTVPTLRMNHPLGCFLAVL